MSPLLKPADRGVFPTLQSILQRLLNFSAQVFPYAFGDGNQSGKPLAQIFQYLAIGHGLPYQDGFNGAILTSTQVTSLHLFGAQ